MLANGFDSIMRTTGGKTTMIAKPRAEQILVNAYGYNQDFSHCLMTLFQCFSRLAFKLALSIFKIGRRTMITMSRAGSRNWFLRKLSRKILFSRFLWTALGICFFAIAKPSLGTKPGCFLTSIVILPSAWRKLFWNTCLYSIARVNLFCLGKDSSAQTHTLMVSGEPCLWLDEP